MKKIKTRLALTFFCLCLLLLSAQSGLAQNTAAAAQNPSNADESANSTVIYTADSFSQYNPITASDMLDRIPGISLRGGGPGSGRGDRGLGTGGNLLINGQRIAGKGNSARDQLDRITADRKSVV